MRVPIILDMETSDPDDFLTLVLLLGHPRVDLRGVLVVPGSPAQVGWVRRALGWFGREVPVGAWNIDHPKGCVSSWHESTFGECEPSRDAEPGPELLRRLASEDVTLLTGAAPKNLAGALRLGGLRLGRWVAQGGFAGEGVVPPERQLAKFRGLATCPTFNFNGDPKGTLLALAAPEVASKVLVSKNVCHGVPYDRALHERVSAVPSYSMQIVQHAMGHYLRDHPAGKLLHDPLAACCAVDEGVGEWAEVEVYRERGEWGSRLRPGSGTRIIVGYDHERFVRVLTESAPA